MKTFENFAWIYISIPLLAIVYFGLISDWSGGWIDFLNLKNQNNFNFTWLTFILLGYLVSLFKNNQLFWFGLFESLVVLILCVICVYHYADKNIIASFSGLTAGIFAMGRCWEKIIEGSKKPRLGNNFLDRWWPLKKD